MVDTNPARLAHHEKDGSSPRPRPDDLLSTADAAEFLHVKAGTLEVWRSSGRYGLKFLKIGRCVRYRRADLESWLASREASSTSRPAEAKPEQRKPVRRSPRP